MQAAVLGAQLMVLAQQPWEVFREQALIPYQEKWRSLRESEPPCPWRAAALLRRRSGARRRSWARSTYWSTSPPWSSTTRSVASTSRTSRATSSTATLPKRSSRWACEAMAEMYASLNCYGTPEQIIEKLQQQRDILGCDHNIIVIPKYGSMTQEEADASVALFAREVMPHFKR